MDEEPEFLLKRASEEALRAIASESEEASKAHHGMAIRYSAKALLELSNADESEDEAQSPGIGEAAAR